MKVWGNWDDLVEKCRKQDEELKRRGGERSWYDIISENLGFYTAKRRDVISESPDGNSS